MTDSGVLMPIAEGGVPFCATLQIERLQASGEPLACVAFRVREALSCLYDLQVEATCTDPALPLDQMVGSAAVVAMEVAGQRRRFGGIVSTIEQQDALPTGPFRYMLTIEPRAALLTRGRRDRVFQRMSVVDIVTEVIVDARVGYGDRDIEWRLAAEPALRPFVMQYRESDWAFVSRLLEEAGISYFFELGERGEKLVLCDDPEQFSVADGPPLSYQPLSYQQQDSESAGAVLTSWRTVARVVPQRVSLHDADSARLDVPLRAEAAIDEAGLGRVVMHNAGFDTPERGAALATLHAQRWQCQRQQRRGHGYALPLAAGHRFVVQAHPRAGANGVQLATRVEHIADEHGYRCAVEALDAKIVYRPQLATPRPHMSGVIPARLDALAAGDGAARDEEGRYRVVLPFDGRGAAEGEASLPLPLARPYGGLDMPLPKGADVMVASIDGNPDRLLITGAVAEPRAREHSLIQFGRGVDTSASRIGHGQRRLERSQLLSPRHAMSSSYNTAKANYDTAVTNYDTAKTNYDTAQTDLDAKVTAYNTAKSTRDTHQASYDTAVSAANTAKSNRDAAQAAYDSAVAGGDPAQITAAEQSLNDAQASLNTAEAAVTTAETALNTSQAALNTAEAAVNTAEAAVDTQQEALNNADAAVTTAAQALNDAEAEVHVYEDGSSGSSSNDTWLKFRVPHTDGKTSYLRLGEAPGDELSSFRVPNPTESGTITLDQDGGLALNTTGNPKKGKAGAFAYTKADRTIVTSGKLEEYTGGDKRETVRGNLIVKIDGYKQETIDKYYKLTINDGTLGLYDAVSPYKLDFRKVAGSWRKTEVSKVTTDTYTFGDTESYFLGYNFEGTSGIASSLFVGASVAGSLGVNINANVGADVSFDVGYRYSFTAGKSYARSEKADTVATDEISLRVKPDENAAATMKKIQVAGGIAGGVAAVAAGIIFGSVQGATTEGDKTGDGDNIAAGSAAGVTLSTIYTAGLSAALMAMAIVDWRTKRVHQHGQTTLIMTDNKIKMVTDKASLIMKRKTIHLSGDVFFHKNHASRSNYAWITRTGIKFGKSGKKVPIEFWGTGKATGTNMTWS